MILNASAEWNQGHSREASSHPCAKVTLDDCSAIPNGWSADFMLSIVIPRISPVSSVCLMFFSRSSDVLHLSVTSGNGAPRHDAAPIMHQGLQPGPGVGSCTNGSSKALKNRVKIVIQCEFTAKQSKKYQNMTSNRNIDWHPDSNWIVTWHWRLHASSESSLKSTLVKELIRCWRILQDAEGMLKV